MNNQFGLYPQFYVKRKDLLFPLIEKYYGVSMKGKTHGQAIKIYLGLLRTNEAFRGEIDGLIAEKFKNAIDPVTGIAEAVGKLFGMFSGSVRTAKLNLEAQEDANFTAIILAEQNKSNTGTILIISVVTLGILGLGVWLIVKMKK